MFIIRSSWISLSDTGTYLHVNTGPGTDMKNYQIQVSRIFLLQKLPFRGRPHFLFHFHFCVFMLLTSRGFPLHSLSFWNFVFSSFLSNPEATQASLQIPGLMASIPKTPKSKFHEYSKTPRSRLHEYWKQHSPSFMLCMHKTLTLKGKNSSFAKM